MLFGRFVLSIYSNTLAQPPLQGWGFWPSSLLVSSSCAPTESCQVIASHAGHSTTPLDEDIRLHVLELS